MSDLIVGELREQPDVVARLAATAPDTLAPWVAQLKDDQPIVLLARGSSDNAARYGAYLLAVRSARLTALALPSVVTLYRRDEMFTPATPLIAISQSGRSPDLIATLEAARRQGSPTLAITNDPDSPLAHSAGHVLDLGCGPELAVAATKSYTASLAALVSLTTALGATGHELLNTAAVPALRTAIDTEAPAEAVALLRAHRRCIVIGRGYHLSTAHEAALKLQELTGILTQPLSPADLEHGPIAALDHEVPVIFVATQGPTLDHTRQIIERARRAGSPTIAITDVEHLGDEVDVTLQLPCDVPDWLSPLVAIVPLQQLAIETARALHRSVDQPAGLSKITETR